MGTHRARTCVSLGLAVFATLLAPAVSTADSRTFYFGQRINWGNQPPQGTTTPWLTAKFADGNDCSPTPCTAGQVQLKVTSMNLIKREHVGFFYFNVDPAKLPLTVAEDPGQIFLTFHTDIFQGNDAERFQNAPWYFDVVLRYPGSSNPSCPNYFLGNTGASFPCPSGPTSKYSTVTYTLSATGLTASSFQRLDSTGTFYVAAWIQDIDPLGVSQGQAGGITSNPLFPGSWKEWQECPVSSSCP